MAPRKKLSVCESMRLRGLVLVQVISKGMRHRKVGSHELNLESSRSHSIMTVYCDCVATGEEQQSQLTGKISFVDLAGSERLKDSKSCGETLKETSSINRSLFTLGKVISSLTSFDLCVPYKHCVSAIHKKACVVAVARWHLSWASFEVVASVGLVQSTEAGFLTLLMVSHASHSSWCALINLVGLFLILGTR
jgi:hypothetical protein